MLHQFDRPPIRVFDNRSRPPLRLFQITYDFQAAISIQCEDRFNVIHLESQSGASIHLVYRLSRVDSTTTPSTSAAQ